jgi:imidazolonepropionase-like amidohydrolase
MPHSDLVRPPATGRELLLRDATVVDVDTGAATAHQDLRIARGRISAISGHDPARRPEDGAGLEVVDAAGAFVEPGFVDAHAHALNHPDEVDGAYALMLAAGVCGFRQMSGDDRLLERRAAGPLRTPTGAPRLLALPGDLLTPLNAGTARAAAASVRHQAARGADFIKAGFTSARTFMAALREAVRLGIPLAGHLPEDLDPREAVRGGVRCIEHLGPGTSLIAASSRREEQARAMGSSLPPVPPLRLLQPLVQRPLLRFVVNPAAATGPRTATAYEVAARWTDPAKMQALAELLVEHGTWNCPTLIRLHTQAFGDRPIHLEDSRREYIHPEELAGWEEASRRLAALPARTREALAEDWEAKQRMARTLADAGAPMLTGTDANGAGWVIPGFALHDEFDLLAEAGLPPARILRMATLDAARFFGRQEAAGRVAVGCEADLVLLGADPLADHRALHRITGVVRDGGWYSREVLDGVLERAAARPTAR